MIFTYIKIYNFKMTCKDNKIIVSLTKKYDAQNGIYILFVLDAGKFGSFRTNIPPRSSDERASVSDSGRFDATFG